MDHKIISNGFGGKVVQTELTLLIEHVQDRIILQPWRVHLFHGTPAHVKWFHNREPIASFKTRAEAEGMVDRLGGLVDTHKHFPVVSTQWAWNGTISTVIEEPVL